MYRRRSPLRLPEDEFKKLREQVYQRDRWRCRVCRAAKPLHAHHIVFKSHGGDDASWNLITLCKPCHEDLHDRWIVILPKNDGDEIINADIGVRIMVLPGWKPKNRHAQSKRSQY